MEFAGAVCGLKFTAILKIIHLFYTRSNNLPHIRIHFQSKKDKGEEDVDLQLCSQVRPHYQETALLSLTENGETHGADVSLKAGTVVLDLSSLLSLPNSSSSSIKMLRRVLAWIERQQVSPRHVEGENRQRGESLQFILTATTPLALWRLQNVAREQYQEQTQKNYAKRGEDESESNVSATHDRGDTPIFHLQILGPNHDLLVRQVDWLLKSTCLSPDSTPVELTLTRADSPSKEGMSKPPPDSKPEESSGVSPSPNHVAAEVDNEASDELILNEFLSFRPSLGVLSSLSGAKDAKEGAKRVKDLVATETARLRVLLEGGGGKSHTDQPCMKAVLLWDVLQAIHGESIDIITCGNVQSAAQRGIVSLEKVLQLCDNNFGQLEALLAEGWLEFYYPEIDQTLQNGSSAEGENEKGRGKSYRHAHIEKNPTARETLTADGALSAWSDPLVMRKGSERMGESSAEILRAFHSEGEEGGAEVVNGTAVRSQLRSTEVALGSLNDQNPLLVCQGSFENLHGSDTDDDDKGLDSVPLPRWLTTPATVALAWKNLEMDPALIKRMNVRADARHFVQEASLLQYHRQALSAEWAELYRGRGALRARASELTDEDFINLQLELIRLEKGAASRALEMSLRRKRLQELHRALGDSLSAEETPSMELLKGEVPQPTRHVFEKGAVVGEEIPGPYIEGQDPYDELPIEERVLVEMDRGLRGVPVVDVTASMSSSRAQEEDKETAAAWKWWPWRRKRTD